jgi:hypothetical protein
MRAIRAIADGCVYTRAERLADDKMRPDPIALHHLDQAALSL